MYDFEDIDRAIENALLTYEITHPTCPECGGNMYKMRENYNLDDNVKIDEWYECPNCGHCTKF